MTEHEDKIPKKIHYCWFGGKQLPKAVIENINSWKKYCPDYEIIEWNEKNYDIKKNKYMYQAYKNKIWGFVPDYARLDIIYNEGGIYLDTDVELIKSLDPLLEYDAFMGFEDDIHVSPGLGFGAKKHHNTIRQLRDMYNDYSFIKEDGKTNRKPSPQYNTEFLLKHGLVCGNTRQRVADIEIFPKDFFCPIDFSTGRKNITENTISIHKFEMSWIDPMIRRWHKREQRLARRIGCERARKFIRVASYPAKILDKFKKKIKQTINK